MFKRRKMRFNDEWSLLAGDRVYELNIYLNISLISISEKKVNWYLFQFSRDKRSKYCLKIGFLVLSEVFVLGVRKLIN